MMRKYQQVFENNKKWAEERSRADSEFFKNLARQQTPEFLFIGCSDSRVPANEITGLEMGDLFVHRNVGNLVVNTDINILSVLQYAIEELKVKHIVVCGHYGCGGVHAAMQNREFGLLDNWLRNIRDVYRLHRDELELVLDEKAKFHRLVELNIIEQCINVTKTGYFQQSYRKNSFPTVHGWVYDLNNGILKDLNIDFVNVMKKNQSIYRIK